MENIEKGFRYMGQLGMFVTLLGGYSMFTVEDVERVHNDHHPELHQVAALYAELKQNPSREVFDKLRDVTKNYTLPEDACQAYTKVYNMLEELDKAFV